MFFPVFSQYQLNAIQSWKRIDLDLYKKKFYLKTRSIINRGYFHQIVIIFSLSIAMVSKCHTKSKSSISVVNTLYKRINRFTVNFPKRSKERPSAGMSVFECQTTAWTASMPTQLLRGSVHRQPNAESNMALYAIAHVQHRNVYSWLTSIDTGMGIYELCNLFALVWYWHSKRRLLFPCIVNISALVTIYRLFESHLTAKSRQLT